MPRTVPARPPPPRREPNNNCSDQPRHTVVCRQGNARLWVVSSGTSAAPCAEKKRTRPRHAFFSVPCRCAPLPFPARPTPKPPRPPRFFTGKALPLFTLACQLARLPAAFPFRASASPSLSRCVISFSLPACLPAHRSQSYTNHLIFGAVRERPRAATTSRPRARGVEDELGLGFLG